MAYRIFSFSQQGAYKQQHFHTEILTQQSIFYITFPTTLYLNRKIMKKNINLHIRFFFLLLAGCHTPPIPMVNEEAEVEETRINLIAGQQTLITLEQLHANTHPSIWEQYFTQRGAEAIWNILQQRHESLNINFEGLAAPILYTNRQREEQEATPPSADGLVSSRAPPALYCFSPCVEASPPNPPSFATRLL